jgi:Skp family chaperone for outer membrane proteins
MHRITVIAILIMLANIIFAQSAIPTPLIAKAESSTVTVSEADQIKHLRLIDSIRALENNIHRLKLEYEAKKSELEASQRTKMDDYTKFITAKRAEYKVGESYEIDIDKGIWVDRKPPVPPADKK